MRNYHRMLCVFLILALGLLPMQAGAKAEASDWTTAYEGILAAWKAQIAADPENVDINPELSYLVYDIDKDTIPEMLVKTGTCSRLSRCILYLPGRAGSPD